MRNKDTDNKLADIVNVITNKIADIDIEQEVITAMIQERNRKLEEIELRKKIAIANIQDSNKRIEELKSRKRIAIAQFQEIQGIEAHTVNDKYREILNKGYKVVITNNITIHSSRIRTKPSKINKARSTLHKYNINFATIRQHILRNLPITGSRLTEYI